ncbi:hypothetical protein GCM10017687_24620 [Streptomyces echinatus]|uniref:hypothetical protein n=1 Tax=Streptomyces echinatus TaxID=67293 RepID=UPI0031EFC139
MAEPAADHPPATVVEDQQPGRRGEPLGRVQRGGQPTVLHRDPDLLRGDPPDHGSAHQMPRQVQAGAGGVDVAVHDDSGAGDAHQPEQQLRVQGEFLTVALNRRTRQQPPQRAWQRERGPEGDRLGTHLKRNRHHASFFTRGQGTDQMIAARPGRAIGMDFDNPSTCTPTTSS